MNDPFNPLNLILLAVAAIVLWRLRSVLGQRTGLERRPQDVQPQRDNVVRLPNADTTTGVDAKPDRQTPPVWTSYAEEGSSTALGLEKIAAVAPEFAVKSFLDGASIAYELVLEAFAKGDKQALKPLLSKVVHESFGKAIDERQSSGQTMKMQFVGVKSAAVEDARLDGKRALISVRFVAEMISAVTAADGATVEGDPTQVRDVHDLWTFERDTSTRDPNWKLVDTSDGTSA